MTIYLTELSATDHLFPSPYQALDEPNGLLAFGGDLSPMRLLAAYRRGIFPWYNTNDPILWWSPTPRAVFNPATFTATKSLKKYQRKVAYRVSINQATPEVIHFCAAVREGNTWINKDMQKAYTQLADMGYCHSVEVWDNTTLVGGLYGLQIGQLFCGESMFSIKTNASKVALWFFCHHFSQHGGQLIDCQVMNDHLTSLGAQSLTRNEFLASLEHLQTQSLASDCFKKQWLPQP